MGNEPYSGNSIHMFRGCASVMIRIKNKDRRVKVIATAEGLFSGETIINVEN